MLKWFWKGSAETTTAAETAPVAKEPPKKIHAIFKGPFGVVAGIKSPYTQPIPIPGPNGKILMRDGKPVLAKPSGSAYNTTTLSGFIESMEGYGHDMSLHRKALEDLKTVTANAGLTEKMAKVRLTGYMFGEPEDPNARVILAPAFPANPKGHTFDAFFPSIDQPGMWNRMTLKL